MSGAPWPLPFRPGELRQPDDRTCGATVLVAARMLLEEGYAARLAAAPDPQAALRLATLGAHRAATGLRDGRGRPQVPWPPPLGTPPWAAARHLTGVARALDLPVRYRVVPALWRRDRLYDRLLTTPHPVALYVGDRWSPRHVLLGLGSVDGVLRCHEPTGGRLLGVDRAAFGEGRVSSGRFGVPWCVVLAVPVSGRGAPPARRPGRRTPA